MAGRLSWKHGVLLVAVTLVLSFQNCSQPAETSADGSSNGGASTGGSYVANLPHAYEAKMDTIAHMSCSNVTVSLPRRSYFTYRVGAYSSSTGGLTLTRAFRDKTKYFSLEERVQALQQSTANANTRLSLSIRSEVSIDSILQEGTTVVGEEIESFLPPLDMTSIATPLAALPVGAMINYFPGSSPQRLMEASLRFYKYDNVIQDSRMRLSPATMGTGSGAFLAVGYSSSSDEANQVLRRPLNGSGFKMQFGLPSGSTAGETRVLSSITEYSLATGSPVTGSSWSCPAYLQFMVVRPEDKAAGFPCNAFVDRADNDQEARALQAIRRVLRVEDWYVDIKNHCVMPRETADYCYGRPDMSVPETRRIQYGVNCANTGTTMCPHFVSVCLRN